MGGARAVVRSAASPALALQHRLPNAPPTFVGRTDAVQRLRTMIERAPVSVVWGLGGLGKTSLVRHTLHRHFGERIERTISVGLRPGDGIDRVATELTVALAALHGRAKVDWNGLAVNEAFHATLIDQVESLGAWVVIDDLHHAERDAADAFLDSVARYARRSRWIVSSRERAGGPELDGQTARLDAMAEIDLRALAGEFAGSLSKAEIDQAIGAAAGSPWRLRQSLAGRDPGSKTFARDLLEGLPAEVTSFVEAMTIVAPALRSETLIQAFGLSGVDVLLQLERRGLLDRAGDSYRLHDLVRTLLSAVVELRERTPLVARALAESTDPIALLEALRLYLSLGGIEDAGALLDRHGEALFSGGYAPRLWPILSATTHQRLSRPRLRCAVELGDPTALARIELPPDSTPLDHLYGAYALFLRGNLTETIAAAGQVRAFGVAAAPYDPRAATLAHFAGVLESACLGETGRCEEAVAVLESLPSPSPEAAMVCNVHLSRWHTHLGDGARARTILDGLGGAAFAGATPLSGELRAELVASHALAGSMRALQGTLEAIGLANSLGPADLFTNRRSTLAEVVRDVFAGRLAEADATLRALRPLLAQTSYLRSFVLAIDVDRRLAAGELEELESAIERMRSEAFSCRHTPNYQWSIYQAVRLATLRGEPSLQLPEPPVRLPSTRYWDVGHALAIERHARLHGLAHDERPPLPVGNVHFACLAARTDVAIALLAGDAETARRHALASIELARDAGLGPTELDATLDLLDALLVLGAHDEAARVLDGAMRTARLFPSPRLVGELGFVALTLGERIDPGKLGEVAAGHERAPVAARRARALLGERAPLDTVDRVIVAALRGRATVPAVRRIDRPVETEAPAVGWGLDVARSLVWLPGDRSVDFRSRALLFRILVTLARRGGAATKEQLVREVWGLPNYHPLRDDKRLQVAIRKLRLLVEDDASNAQRVVTTDDGYRLGDREPLRVVDDGPR